VAALGVMGFAWTSDAEAQILGTAEDFGVLAGTTVTNTGSSVIEGSVGVSPGSAVIGFPPGIVVAPGTIHIADGVAGQAQIDTTAAYNTLQGLPSQVNLTGQDLGGLVLPPAVYSFSASAQLTGVLTLNGLGNTASQWVFQIASALTTASNSAILLINGANGANVYWAVGSSATLGTNSVFAGNIIALTDITLNTGATMNCGRALARNGAVTLDSNTITLCGASALGFDGFSDDITLNALFGEGVSGSQQTAFGASNLFGSAMMREAAFWADGIGQDLNGITPKKNQPMKLGVFDSAPIGLVTGSSYQPRTWRAWAAGFGGRSELDGIADIGSADLNSHTRGFAVGFDAQIDRTALVGVAAGYSNSGFSVDELTTSGTVEGFHAGLYGVKRLGALYVEADAEYVHFQNSTDRFIDWVVDEQAQGQFDSDAFSAQVESGWRRAYGEHRVTPFVGLRVDHLRSDEFTEASQSSFGGPGILGLTFDSDSVTSLTSRLGVQFDTRITLYNGQVLTPFARIAWVHEFNPDRSVDSFLTLSPEAAFTAEGAAAASDAAKIYAGLKLELADNVGLFGYFDGEFSDRSQSYAGTGAIKIAW
jgi:uncharacterized protein YhjY with autotransporter beta-barrel domain